MIEYRKNVKNNLLIQGYYVLKTMGKNRIFISDLSEKLMKNSNFNFNDFFSTLILLYSLGVIEFEDGYLWIER
ncbi:MAG: hypothetical protein IJR67_04015 [Acholeplasmatales bacterium]|nr:hypothetical protein [Acholeplasmatales bacterium]